MSTENEYTPTTEDVREGYVENRLFLAANIPLSIVRAHAEFDRWLAADSAEVAAKALEDAADIAETGEGTEAEAWADWLRRRAAALRASTEEPTDDKLPAD